MDAKTVVSKTLFFLAMCLFISIFTSIFGEENSLVGVIVVVIALMLLGKDFSVRPWWNLGGLSVLMVVMGLGAFLSLLNPYVGLAINFLFVFFVVFITMQDLKSPMHYPFLLGYAFLLSIPIPAEEMSMRLFSLFIGAVLIVILNVIMNYKKMDKTYHSSLMLVCDEITDNCQQILRNETPTIENMDRICTNVNNVLFDRLKDNFYASPKDRSVMNLVASIRNLGRAVCHHERNPDVLTALTVLMNDIKAYEDDQLTLEALHEAIEGFMQKHPEADFAILSSLRNIDSEFMRMDGADNADIYPDEEVPVAFRFKTIMKENMRTDSVRFTFAFRMALLFSLWAFIWQNWELDNARWLLFTTIAVTVPYIEGSWKKSAMRVSGTLVGAFAFMAILMLINNDPSVMVIIMLLLNYVYTLFDPQRYDIKMIFITLSGLMTAFIADPSDAVLAERLLYILGGVAAAVLANHIILPYRLRDENQELSARFLQISYRQLENLAKAADGNPDVSEDAYLTLTANNLSVKLSMNLRSEHDANLGRFVSGQTALGIEIALLAKSVTRVGTECKERFKDIVLDWRNPKDDISDLLVGMEPNEAELLRRAAGAVRTYRSNRIALADSIMETF